MTAARFAGALLVVFAAALNAQNTSADQVAITVVDQSGAVIPTAHIGIILLPAAVPPPANPQDTDWISHAQHTAEQMSAKANASSEATFHLEKGSYAISITAQGFAHYLQRIDLRDGSNHTLRVTLIINGRTDCMACVFESPIPLERPVLDALIPLEPLQTIRLNATRLRRR